LFKESNLELDNSNVVLSNIQQLEQNINILTQQLNQAQQNLVASKGAVIGYDRLLAAFAPPLPVGVPVGTEPVLSEPADPATN
jgi:hypothetical protein